jgi:hypothetical protein
MIKRQEMYALQEEEDEEEDVVFDGQVVLPSNRKVPRVAKQFKEDTKPTRHSYIQDVKRITEE